ncbi:drug efflux protein [gut metagenome]|uniref:Drug efflux protein n=1 Tax=gut metagenome TaxID=749906 RepID=J9GC50_9ZZZZ
MKNSRKERSFYRSSFTIIITFVCLSLVGVALMPFLPVKLSPSREMPSFYISYTLPGQSAKAVEAEVTSRLEGMISRINGIKKLSSFSDNGSGHIQIELDKHAPIAATRFEISTMIRQIWPQLPEGVSYPMLSTLYSDDKASKPFMVYILNAPATPSEIQKFGEEYIKPKLAALGSIYKLEFSGATPMEWHLTYDNTYLEGLGIGIQEIQEAINLQYEKEFMGICEWDCNGKSEWIRLVRTTRNSQQAFSPSEILVKTKDNGLVALDRLVKVTRVEQEPISYFRINGQNALYLTITASKTANQLSLAKEVKNAMDELKSGMPPGYEVSLSYDATDYISKELDTLSFRTGITIAILLLFIALITRNKRYLALIVAGLFVNLAVAVILYYVLGVEIQLYSLAGITISLNLVIDNLIVMSDHIRRKCNLKAFMSVLAATLTTVGALTIIFFLDENIRLNLQDFAVVLIINLGVSLLIALFFIPSMMEKIGLLAESPQASYRRMKRGVVYFNRVYAWLIVWLIRHRKFAWSVLILSFGLPVFWLPEKIENEREKGAWAVWYNQVFDNPVYQELVKPIVHSALGGTLRLFVEKVYTGRYMTPDEDERVLEIYAQLPNGCTLTQMNETVKKMESYLAHFDEIRQFNTSVYNANHAAIQVYFKKEFIHTDFPYTLHSNVVQHSQAIGGGSWTVKGLENAGYSNRIHENAGNYRIKMYGYNYDELNHWAEEMKKQLLTHRRVKKLTISPSFSWWKEDYSEYQLVFDKEIMAKENLTAYDLFRILRPVFMRNQSIGNVLFDGKMESVRFSSVQSAQYDSWAFMSIPLKINHTYYKLSDLASLTKGETNRQIAKENQQYVLCIQYEYLGTDDQALRFLLKDLSIIYEQLPMGYTLDCDNLKRKWKQEADNPYRWLGVLILIIYFISAILFNSLRQPLITIFIIPISYIGVFLTFYLYKLHFDQGGFASFILLSGITVNASIYLLNEFNHNRKNYPKRSLLKNYLKAWNVKIVPILLTVFSTILGFIPFLIGEQTAFWFPLAAGTIGGLLMSLVGIFCYLPILSLAKKKVCPAPKKVKGKTAQA